MKPEAQVYYDALQAVIEALYPNGDRDHQWDADTLDEIARVVEPFVWTSKKRKARKVVR